MKHLCYSRFTIWETTNETGPYHNLKTLPGDFERKNQNSYTNEQKILYIKC